MSSRQQVLYAIGRIAKVFGIKGEVVVQPMTGSLQRFKKLKQVFIGGGAGDVRTFEVEYVRLADRGVRLRFREASDRTSVEPLVGALLFVDEQHLLRPKEGSYFIHDIVGLRVVDEHDTEVGVVKDVLRYPAQDVYVIDHDGHEWMIPAVKEFVTSIDMAAKTMRVHLIEGMIEEG